MGTALNGTYAMTPGSFKLLDHHGNIIATGASSREAMAPLPDSAARKAMLSEWARYKADAAEARLQQTRARDASIRTLNDGITRLTHRIDAEVAHRTRRHKAAELKAAEDEARRIQAKLDAGPDPDDPASYGSGLTPLPASHPEDKRQLAASHMGSDAENAEGDLPEDLLRTVPAPAGEFAYEHPPRQVSQPILVSLNMAD
jgi:hypothetical protein